MDALPDDMDFSGSALELDSLCWPDQAADGDIEDFTPIYLSPLIDRATDQDLSNPDFAGIRINGRLDIHLTLSSLKLLQSANSWLNDDVINCFLMDRGHFVDSWFTKSFLASKATVSGSSVLSRTSLFSEKRVFFLFHQNDCHWVGIAADPSSHKIQGIDSFSQNTVAERRAVLDMFEQCAAQRGLPFHRASWLSEEYPETPQQRDGFSCVVLTSLVGQLFLEENAEMSEAASYDLTSYRETMLDDLLGRGTKVDSRPAPCVSPVDDGSSSTSSKSYYQLVATPPLVHYESSDQDGSNSSTSSTSSTYSTSSTSGTSSTSTSSSSEGNAFSSDSSGSNQLK